MNNRLEVLKVRDMDDILEISYEDLLKYHGHNMVGGVALAYKIMLWAFPQLCNDIPSRGHFYFLSGIGPNGKGMIDAVEMVMRVKTYGCLDTDVSLLQDKEAPYTPGDGKYYFEIGYKQKKLCFSVRPGLIPDDFYYYSRLAHENERNHRENSSDEARQLKRVRNELAALILSTPSHQLFQINE